MPELELPAAGAAVIFAAAGDIGGAGDATAAIRMLQTPGICSHLLALQIAGGHRCWPCLAAKYTSFAADAPDQLNAQSPTFRRLKSNRRTLSAAGCCSAVVAAIPSGCCRCLPAACVYRTEGDQSESYTSRCANKIRTAQCIVRGVAKRAKGCSQYRSIQWTLSFKKLHYQKAVHLCRGEASIRCQAGAWLGTP